jgi:uncharacterized protein YecE (DUF72 family)
MVERWCQQTPAHFTFDVKLHRLLSRHSTGLNALPPELRKNALVKGGNVEPTPELERALLEQFLREINPLVEASKLGALLLQLTPGFGPARHTLEELDPLIEQVAGYRLAVELRNRRWVVGDQLVQTLAFFKSRGLAFVAVDAPQTDHFMAMPSLDAVTRRDLAYLRLHGRNVKGYVSGRTVAQRFDHNYSGAELEELAKRAVQLATEAAETHVIYNNNAADYALRNATTFQELLAKQHPESAPLPRPVQRPERGPGRNLEFEFGG